MGRGKLTPQEMNLLKQNPNVAEVSKERIIYEESFKQHFMQEYLAGKGPTAIFREAGLPPQLIGSKRIERAAARWKEAYFAGNLGRYRASIRHRESLNGPSMTAKERTELTAKQARRKLQKKEKQILMLQEENMLLKKQLRLLLEEQAGEWE